MNKNAKIVVGLIVAAILLYAGYAIWGSSDSYEENRIDYERGYNWPSAVGYDLASIDLDARIKLPQNGAGSRCMSPVQRGHNAAGHGHPDDANHREKRPSMARQRIPAGHDQSHESPVLRSDPPPPRQPMRVRYPTDTPPIKSWNNCERANSYTGADWDGV